jgi:hypothetical protein
MKTNSKIPKVITLIVLIMWSISLFMLIYTITTKKHQKQAKEQVYNPNEDELDSIEYSRRIITNE